MTISGDAVYRIDGDLCTMRFERQFAQPVERVWAALTQPDDLKAWFYPFQGTLAAGETVTIPWEEDGGLSSKIVEFDPPKTFAWTWNQPGEPEAVVRWELRPEAGGTHFTLTHNLTILGPREPTDTLAGWQEHLDTLADYLDGNPRSWSNETWRALKDRYAFEIEKPDVHGRVETINGKRQLHFARVLEFPLEKVWQALSTDAGVSGWFTDATIDLRDGGSYTLDFTKFGDHAYTYPILQLDPPRVVEFKFGDHDDDVVRWELFDGGDRTLLVLTNRLSPEADAAGQLGGWHYHLDRLPSALAGEPDPRTEALLPSVNAHYAGAVGD
jgi:uncharacterized protein YndB with AHSA1/START domain